MAVITRERINSRSTALTQGSIDPSLQIREVKDFIKIVSRFDAPMLDAMGPAKTWDKVEIEFGEGDIVPRTTLLNAAIADGTATGITLVTGGADIIQQWDVLAIEDERILVTEKPASGTALANVVRGFGTSNGSAHATGLVVRVLGPAVPEGADAPVSPMRAGVVYKNFMQILEYSFKLTHRARVTKTYEFMTDQFKAQLEKHMKQATLDLSAIALLNNSNEGDGTITNPSATGGVLEFTTVWSTDLGTGTVKLTLTDIVNQLQNMYNDVGRSAMGRTIMGSAKTKRIWDSFFVGGIRNYKESADVAKSDWETYSSSFGPLKYVINYDMPDSIVLIWNPDDCDRLFYANGGSWSTGVYATLGWYEHGFLRADVGFKWPNPRARAKIFDFDTNLANYTNIDKIS